MELDEQSVEVLADWLSDSFDRAEGDKEQILEFVDRVADGSWYGRWSSQRDVAPLFGSQQHVVHLREGLAMVVIVDYDGQPDVLHIASVLSG